jgi:Protein of unknown function (DUF1302)
MMKNKFSFPWQTSKSNTARTALSLAMGLSLASGAYAYKYENGDFSLNVDTSLSYGVSVRVQDQDPNLIGKCNLAPCQGFQANGAPFIPVSAFPNDAQRAAPGRFSVNGDDGNLNYQSGKPFANTAKITQELGFTYGQDFGGLVRWTAFYDFENQRRDDLSDLAKSKVGKDGQLLDAFVYYNYGLGNFDGSLRVGRQVVSWGESTFIQNGINIVNPIDVSKLRIAGAELKEAFLPIDMLWTSISFNENFSAEALYMLEFEQTEPEPTGTYFSTNDFGSLGAQYVMLGFGTTGEPTNFANCFRPGSIPASNVGEVAACATAVPRLQDRYPQDNGQYGAALRYFSPELNNTEFGLFYLNYHSRLPFASGIAVTGQAANSARYFIEYPDDIKLYGVSFNTTLEESGVALQGEMSYRPNQPLQVDDVELLFAALSPLNTIIAQPFNRFYSQYGQLRPGQEVRGWNRHEVSQFQMTTTKVFGPGNFMAADQISAVAEFGATKVWDLPDQDVLRYNGDGTDTGCGPDVRNGNSRNPVQACDGFATSFSWGYRLAGRADYNNFLGSPYTVSPRVAFNHDVNGITPGAGGNFLEGRRSLTLGVEANYLNQWSADLSYTRFSGAGAFNLINDRDFVAVTAKYAF